RTRDRWGQAVSDCQRCPAPDPRRHVGYGDGDCLRLAQSPCLVSSPAACFRFTGFDQHWLNPIMSTDGATLVWGKGGSLPASGKSTRWQLPSPSRQPTLSLRSSLGDGSPNLISNSR